jgi:hypothetical protein
MMVDRSGGFQFDDHPTNELTAAHDFCETGFVSLIEFGDVNVGAECNARPCRQRRQLFGNERRIHGQTAQVNA